jgi:ketosteroid isomerase-like protein
MRMTRRAALALVGTIAFGAASLLGGIDAESQSAEEAAVNQAIEALRKAMLDADKARLEDLVADQLSYGHSGGVIESKAQFVNVIVSKKTIYKSITLSNASTVIAGDNAIARHIFSAETETDGKPGTARVGVLQVWKKQPDGWKLLARQAFRLPS